MSEEKVKYVYGIDLGTTFSCIARVESDGLATVIKNLDGTYTTPSVVNFQGNEFTVGQSAKDLAVVDAKNTISFVKTLMGKTQMAIEIDGRVYSPAEISGFILKKITSDASQITSDNVKDVVITVPAYFGENERAETKLAGEYAGLNVLGIISEPVASAICYGFSRNSDENTIMVYDLGGGTFDITIMHVKSREIEVICSEGDHTLGGKNWDEKIVGYFKRYYKEQTGFSGEFEPEDEQDLLLRAEKAKIALSLKESTKVTLQCQGKRQPLEFTRHTFEDITRSLLERTIDLTNKAMETAKKSNYTVDKILLVGGSTSMPQVSKILKETYNIEPTIFDPDEAVAKGAAYYAIEKFSNIPDNPDIGLRDDEIEKIKEEIKYLPSTRGRDGEIKKIKVTYATIKSFALQALVKGELKCNNMILRNTRMEDGVISVTREFATNDNNQEEAELVVYESDIDDELFEVDSDLELGRATLSLPSGLPKGTPVSVTFKLDKEGTLYVSGMYDETHTTEVKFERKNSLSSEEIKERKENFNTLVMKE